MAEFQQIAIIPRCAIMHKVLSNMVYRIAQWNSNKSLFFFLQSTIDNTGSNADTN